MEAVDRPHDDGIPRLESGTSCPLSVRFKTKMTLMRMSRSGMRSRKKPDNFLVSCGDVLH